VGSGQDEDRLKKLAGPTIEFLGSISNSAIAELYSNCRAFIFPGVEDFGITLVEALTSGTPVIALQKGGAAEIVTKKTGHFFTSQTVEAIIHTVQEFEKNPNLITEQDCRNRGYEFSKKRFQSEFYQAIRNTWASAGKDTSLLEGTVISPGTSFS
jgi:glycosyltransferase involved in cell wall biosynthesis